MFDSEKFDPLFALYSKDLKLNPQKKHPFQNFAKFEAALKRVGIYGMASKKQIIQKSSKKDTDMEDVNAVRNFLPHQSEFVIF